MNIKETGIVVVTASLLCGASAFAGNPSEKSAVDSKPKGEYGARTEGSHMERSSDASRQTSMQQSAKQKQQQASNRAQGSAGSQAAGHPPATIMAATVSARGTVENIDKQEQRITLRDEAGNEVTLRADNLTNFDQIKKGDKVTARYTESVGVALDTSKDKQDIVVSRTARVSPKGEKPSAYVVDTVNTEATVQRIDPESRSLVLRGTDGKEHKVSVPENVEGFERLKKGQQIEITATEMVALDVRTSEGQGRG